MSSLFQPDFFSAPRPVFNPISTEGYSQITDILHKHYDIDSHDVVSISALDGLEVNSKNFRVETSKGIYALKRSGKNANLRNSAYQMEISQKLNALGASMPNAIYSHDGICAEDNNKFWILTDFVEGGYFSGSSNDYLSAIDAIVALQNAIDHCEGGQGLPLASLNNSWSETARIFQEFYSRKPEWNSLFPDEEKILLIGESDHLKQCIEKVSESTNHAVREILPTHIDLHPHNILVGDGGRVVIVDVDSLQRANRLQSIAFAIFKLTRQHIVYEAPRDFSQPALKFMNTLGVKNNSVREYYYAALAEILRRIGIIISLNMNHANSEWNKVLKLQLMALHEAAPIFGQE